jgi:hypothetical protein
MDLACQVLIGGNDVSNYVVSIERNQSICEISSVGVVRLSFEYATTVDPYDDVVIYEQGTKVFTGLVASAEKSRMAPDVSIQIQDYTLRLQDYWIDTEYRSTGETAEYWIGFFCTLAGVSYVFDTSYGRIVPAVKPDEYGWQFTSAFDIIRQLVVIGGLHVFSDADGTLHFAKLAAGALGDSLAILHFARERSLDYSRNKAIVFGKYPSFASATKTVSELGTREKTAILASPYIDSYSYALNLATNMVNHFARASDVKTVEVEGNPNLVVGYNINVAESWSGINTSCMITSLSTTMSNAGYRMTLVLDELCPYIWGYFVTVVGKLYASTDGHGVWVSTDLGMFWDDISGDLPSQALYVRGISASGNMVWAATEYGVYVTYSGGGHWEDKTPVLPAGCYNADWTDVEIDPHDPNTVYAYMYDMDNYAAYMHKTGDNGATWANVEVK